MGTKLNVLLAKTDQLSAVSKKNLTDSIGQFKNKQVHFRGERNIYKEKSAEFAEPKNNIDKPVASTVKEWLKYTAEQSGEFLTAKLNQEATNCSNTAKAKLVIEGVDFGEYTTGELMALKGFFEQQSLREMYESMPTISLSERWTPSQDPNYKERGILESEVQTWIDKVTETAPEVVFDPQGKQPGVVINKKSTIERADVTRQTFTGEISHIERAAILKRLTTIIIAIKSALEQANNAEVVESQFSAEKIFTYLNGK